MVKNTAIAIVRYTFPAVLAAACLLTGTPARAEVSESPAAETTESLRNRLLSSDGLEPLAPLAGQQIFSNYLLGPGDQITVEVEGYDEFNNTFVISPDGSITLPLIGSVTASGSTIEQLEQSLAQALTYYLVEPAVTARLTVLRPVVVTVAGEVHRPGPVQLTSLTNSNAVVPSPDNNIRQPTTEALPTLGSALLAAGGITRSADVRSVVVRRLMPNGRTQEVNVDLWSMIQSAGTEANLGLRDGDAIFVPELTAGDAIDQRLIARSSLAPEQITVRVVGEVNTPGEVQIPPSATVASAVAAAGGPTPDARLSRAYLVRLNENGQLEEQDLDLKNFDDSRPVEVGDVIVVPKRGELAIADTVGRFVNPFNILRILGIDLFGNDDDN